MMLDAGLSGEGLFTDAVRYRLLADGVLVVHLLFIAFVLAGGLLTLRRPCICQPPHGAH